MRRVISTHIFSNQRLRPAMLDVLQQSGAEAMEIFCAGQHFDYTERADVQEFKRYFAESPLELHSLHGPMYPGHEMGRTGAPVVNVVHPERARRVAAMDELKRGLEVGESIPFRFFVLHLDARDQDWSEQVLEHAVTAIEHLRAFARPLGVTLAVENLNNEVTLPAHLIEVLNVGHFADVGICLDAGHAHIIASKHARERSKTEDATGAATVTRDAIVAEFVRDVRTLLPRVVTTHLHDNDGSRDAHLFPGANAVAADGVPWQELMPLLRDAPHKPAANLELRHQDAAEPESLPRRIGEIWKQIGL